MKDVLSYILNAIVEKPEEIEIKEEDQEDGINYIVTVAKEDMGKVIGKNGKVIKAIRNVMRIPGIKENKKIFVSLTEIPQ